MRPCIRSSSLFAIVALASFANVPSLHAFSWFQAGSVNVVWPGAQSIRYLSPSTFPPGSETDVLILESMVLWNIVPGSVFEYSYIRNDQDYPIDNFDGFSDTAAVPAEDLDPGVLGVTFLVNSGAAWFDMDMVFSDFPEGVGYTLATNPTCDVVAAPIPDGGFSFLLVAVHEMGHALGLGHEPIGNEPAGFNWFVTTMNPRYPSGGPIGDQNIVETHADDRNGVRFLYPASGPSNPPVRDLANADFTAGPVLGKAIPVFFTPAIVYPGDLLTVRSVIENFGITNEFTISQGFYLSTDETITTSDTDLGALLWDLAYGDGFDFDVDIDMPADMAAGTYYLGSIMDDLNQIAETFEDNNTVVYCEPLIVGQRVPEFGNLGADLAVCGQPYSSDAPTVTLPLNMAPITWSLDNPEPGMTINPMTGAISWPAPVPSPFQYRIFVRATNGAGSVTKDIFIGVTGAPPQLSPIANATIAPCDGAYVGPTPQLTNPTCMAPVLNWSFVGSPPPGMTIDNGTGVVSWNDPIPSLSPYTIGVRATNAQGNGTVSWQLTVAGGDLTGDSQIDVADIVPFVDILLGQAPTDQAADMNCDGFVDGRDVGGFVASLIGE
ncbi:MAG: matrixin family metalloprotease [Phycisphaerales bacterium]|nr:matrixin family metalloprotease [Phycisphaerales bacterium]